MASKAYLAFDGDSMFVRTDGGGSTTPALVLGLTGNTGGNFATSGHNLAEVSEGLAAVDAAWAGRYEFVYVIWAGTNTIFDAITAGDASGSGALAASQLAALCAGQRAKGHKVVVVTCLNSSLSAAEHEPQRQILNAAIRADWATYADAMVDLDLVTDLTPPGSVANPTHYHDQTHLLSLGRAKVAAAIATVLNSMVPTVT